MLLCDLGVEEFSYFDFVAEFEQQLLGSGRGTFSFFGKVSDEKDFFQRSYRLEDFARGSRNLLGRVGYELYITQNTFKRFNRRELLLYRLCCFFLDLDIYHYTTKSPEKVKDEVLEYCVKCGIPLPSAIICSGRGLYLKWYLKEPVPSIVLPKWNLIQKTLVEKFECFGVDRKARDASRVLRLIGSWNEKAGRAVEPLWLNLSSDDAQITCYRVREIGDAVLPFTEAEFQQMKRGRLVSLQQEASFARKKKRFVKISGGKDCDVILIGLLYSFVMRGRHIVEDLLLLAKLRGWDKTGIPDGMRVQFVLYLCNHALLSLRGSPDPKEYIETFCVLKDLVPHWSPEKIHSVLSEVYKRSKAMMTPEGWLVRNEKRYPALYTPSNEFLIDLFQITDEELMHLNYIRTDASYALKKQLERRAQGMIPREEYLAEAERRRQEASFWRSQGLSWREVGFRMGISESAAKMILQRK